MMIPIPRSEDLLGFVHILLLLLELLLELYELYLYNGRHRIVFFDDDDDAAGKHDNDLRKRKRKANRNQDRGGKRHRNLRVFLTARAVFIPVRNLTD